MSDKRIEDYALIGDGETAALVHRNGTIDWLCLPRFDSEACFAALLGDDENGCWHLRFEGETGRSRSYRDGSLILETEITCSQGKARQIDFMPMRAQVPRIVRIVECLEGEVSVRNEMRLRFDYGRIHPLVRGAGDGCVMAISGPNAVSLEFDVPIEFADRRFASAQRLGAGERACYALTWFPSHEETPARIDPSEELGSTETFWREWSGNITRDGRYSAMIARSLITLKALMFTPTGGMVAAPTASLPEQPGGERNWDYRFCWLRDATFTLLALTRWGLDDEARDWIKWLRRTVGGEPIDLQPFYLVDGERRAIEWQAGWLHGFNGAQPVRFGNRAEDQLQLDIYGEVIDSLYQASKEGVGDDDDSDQLIRLLASRLEEVWQKPDAGIWESRGEPRHHTYSKVMCWVAFDRASAWLEQRDTALSAHYRDLARTVHAQVLDEGVDEERGCFVIAYGDTAVDASALRIPLVGFLPADDLRVRATVAAIETDLCRNGLFARYDTAATEDGVEGSEGAFVAVSFWLAEVYHMQGRIDDARTLFERVLGRANDLGLLAEQLEFGGDRQLGNFPQGLSHIALLAAADRMQRGRGGAREPAQSK
ncbi:glycoside hydrolase family 15 protein [Croceibacterium aestuarii]|uniref:glycoside hydrolase family 15 protein n=1 Tax=Croceibacterium aestuarii TaxID=3064139 RepID=UPI00272E9316|nr:glycoside hydrolase family 15 protein [Croceibacterium sp. D39]